MTILPACISEQNSLVVSSPFTDEVHREHTNPSTSGELSSCERWGRWEICSHRLGHQRNHLESGAR